MPNHEFTTIDRVPVHVKIGTLVTIAVACVSAATFIASAYAESKQNSKLFSEKIPLIDKVPVLESQYVDTNRRLETIEKKIDTILDKLIKPR